MELRKCSKCGQEKPRTLEYFGKKSSMKDGMNSWCRECICEDRKRYVKANREVVNQKHKEYLQENTDKIREYRKKYYEDNKEKISECRKKYREDNKEKIREYHKRYRKHNKSSEHRKEKMREYTKRYRSKRPEALRRRDQSYRSRKRSLLHTLTLEQWQEILEVFDNKCAYCGKSEAKLTQEHFIPMKKGGEYSKHNIIPACNACNSSKCAQDFDDWYPKQFFYDEKRRYSIVSHLGR